MTPRERWLAVLNHERPDRMPMDYRATPEATARLLAHLGVATLEQAFARLHIDPIVDVGPRYTGPAIPSDSDIYGIGYEDTDYGSGHYHNAVRHPLAGFETVAAIRRNYCWPDLDCYDYSVLAGQVAGQEGAVIRGGGSEPFATYKWLRGVEQAYVDLYEHPDIVHYCLDKLYELCLEKTRRCYEAIPGRIIWTWVAEDLGTQEGLLISLAHIEEYLIPHMRRMATLVHEQGGYVFHHSDGAVRANLPNMIEKVGIDVLDPVQWRCAGMDRQGLARDFGERLSFHGGMDNQQTLPFGSVAEVRREVEENYRVLGARYGYILGPCHNIQSVSPPENVVAMYDAGYELGWR